jgi:hypothetical protein
LHCEGLGEHSRGVASWPCPPNKPAGAGGPRGKPPANFMRWQEAQAPAWRVNACLPACAWGPAAQQRPESLARRGAAAHASLLSLRTHAYRALPAGCCWPPAPPRSRRGGQGAVDQAAEDDEQLAGDLLGAGPSPISRPLPGPCRFMSPHQHVRGAGNYLHYFFLI